MTMSELSLIEAFKGDLQKYSLEQLRYTDGQSWSLGQLYSHVIVVSLEYVDRLESCAAACEEQPQGKTEGGEQLFRLGGFPPVKIQLPDLPGNTPDNTESRESLTAGLDRLLELMKKWKDKTDGVNPNCKMKHGGFGWLNAREWYALVGMHLRHHLRQQSELELKLPQG